MQNILHKGKPATYIVQNDADKDIEWNAEEVHNGASSLLRNVLWSHLHYGWPEYPNTSLKGTEAKKLETTWKWDASTFHFRRWH